MKLSPWHRAMSLSSSFLLLAACVTRAEESLEDRAQSWVGTRQEEVLSYWGEPDETLEIGEGMRILQYEADSDATYPCVVIFSVNRYGFILGSKFNGDRASCREFVKVIPEDDRSLMMRTNLAILEAIDTLRMD